MNYFANGDIIPIGKKIEYNRCRKWIVNWMEEDFLENISRFMYNKKESEV